MDGDLDVDCADVTELVVVILKTSINDVNLDGVVDTDDRDIACANIGAMNACWSQGDVDCDGDVDVNDVNQIGAGACP
jgi:hypothetical protein